MKPGLRPLGTSMAILLLASAIHTDWHFARPAHHRLSLDLSWHWLLAIPVFALAAVYVAKKNPPRLLAISVLLIGLATLIGGVLEPAYEVPWRRDLGLGVRPRAYVGGDCVCDDGHRRVRDYPAANRREESGAVALLTSVSSRLP